MQHNAPVVFTGGGGGGGVPSECVCARNIPHTNLNCKEKRKILHSGLPIITICTDTWPTTVHHGTPRHLNGCSDWKPTWPRYLPSWRHEDQVETMGRPKPPAGPCSSLDRS